MYPKLGSTNIDMYTLLTYGAFLVVLIYNLSMIKEKKKLLSNVSAFFLEESKKSSGMSYSVRENIVTVIEIFVITFVYYFPLTILNPKFGTLLSTGANYFGLLYFVPVILLLFFYLISLNPFRQMDLITPAYPLGLVFAKLGCFCNGCCGGFDCSWGMMNYHDAEPHREFPTQLVEAGLALAIFIFLMIYRKKAKEGTVFPVYVIIYSATRFFSEFTSNKEDLFGPFKLYHILCIIGVLLGIAELILVLKFSDKLSPYFDRPVFTRYKERMKKKASIVHHKRKNK